MLKPHLAWFVVADDWLARFPRAIPHAIFGRQEKPANANMMRTRFQRGMREDDKKPTRGTQDTYTKTRILYEFFAIRVAFLHILS